MTRTNSQDLLGCLLQKYKKASSRVQSQKTVIRSYENIAHISSAKEAINNRRAQLLKEIDHLADIGEKALVESTKKIIEFEALNKDLMEENTRLHSDLERQRLEYRRQIGVSPKAMNSREKENHKDDSPGNDKNDIPADTKTKKPQARKRGAPKGHTGNTRTIPTKVDAFKEKPLPSQCDCGCSTIIPTDQQDTKYIEDILPVCSHITKIEYPRGLCSKCGSLVRHKDAKHGPPSVYRAKFISTSCIIQTDGSNIQKAFSFYLRDSGHSPQSFWSIRGCQQER